MNRSGELDPVPPSSLKNSILAVAPLSLSSHFSSSNFIMHPYLMAFNSWLIADKVHYEISIYIDLLKMLITWIGNQLFFLVRFLLRRWKSDHLYPMARVHLLLLTTLSPSSSCFPCWPLSDEEKKSKKKLVRTRWRKLKINKWKLQISQPEIAKVRWFLPFLVTSEIAGWSIYKGCSTAQIISISSSSVLWSLLQSSNCFERVFQDEVYSSKRYLKTFKHLYFSKFVFIFFLFVLRVFSHFKC